MVDPKLSPARMEVEASWGEVAITIIAARPAKKRNPSRREDGRFKHAFIEYAPLDFECTQNQPVATHEVTSGPNRPTFLMHASTTRSGGMSALN